MKSTYLEPSGLSPSSTLLSEDSTSPANFRSVVIIGFRGVGKSTLGLMASAAFNFKYVDIENCISDYTGVPEAKFASNVSVEEYKFLQFKLIIQAFKENDRARSVFILPSSSIDNHRVFEFLRKKRRDYCIINIECDESRILNYLNYNGNQEKGIQLVHSRISKYRSVSNYNFYNLPSDTTLMKKSLIVVGGDTLDGDGLDHLLLKPVEKEFTQFFSFIVHGYVPLIHSINETNKSTIYEIGNCLQVSFPEASGDEFVKNMDEIVRGADSIEVGIDLIQLIHTSIMQANLRIDESIAQLRRYTYSSIPILVGIKNSISELNEFIKDRSSGSGVKIVDVEQEVRSFYFSILYSIIRLGVEFVVIDLDIFICTESNFLNEIFVNNSYYIVNQLNSMKGNTSILGSYKSNNPEFWTIHKSMGKVQCLDTIELVYEMKLKSLRVSSIARSVYDNFKIVNFLEYCKNNYPDIVISAFNNGLNGKVSKVMNKFLTPIVPVAKMARLNNSCDLTCKELNQALHYSFLLPPLNFYVIGKSETKYLSPLIHNAAYKHLGIPHTYKPIECNTLLHTLSTLRKSANFGGAAIEYPFQSEALNFVDRMSPQVRIIGALDSVIAERTKDDPNKIIGIRGENTEWLGIKLTITDNIAPINAVSKSKSALVLGVGENCRSTVYALIELGYQEIMVYDHSYRKAKELVDHYNSQSPLKSSTHAKYAGLDCEKDQFHHFELVLLKEDEFQSGIPPRDISYPTIVATSSACSERVASEYDVSSNWFRSPSGGVLLVTEYDPLVTPISNTFLKIKCKGWVSCNSLYHLYAQSIVQFEMFTSKAAPRDLIKSLVLRYHSTRTKDR
ncbi:uncharacterized protein RJT20DRAFT_97262 [Scheffersomyces xylosifermentans]|uniref:uncharacterized protein n=1 Tax=Scheffersomyces xylosifermentans TaxID=1304137 RepID=UPI00315DCD2D